MRKDRKGQSSVEMLTTAGIMVAFLIPLAILLFTLTNQNFEEVSKSQADIIAKKLAHEINLVYLGGKNSSKEIILNLPSNVESLNVSEGEVTVYLQISGEISESSHPLILDDDSLNEFSTNSRGLFKLLIVNVNSEVFIYE